VHQNFIGQLRELGRGFRTLMSVIGLYWDVWTRDYRYYSSELRQSKEKCKASEIIVEK
jgi:hypothetical protein